jgi:hypothetical protein
VTDTTYEDEAELWESLLHPIKRLNKDIRLAAATLGDAEARHLVDAYYIAQENRKRAGAQERTLEDNEEPASVVEWLYISQKTIEGQIKLTLDAYTEAHMMGSWMRGVYGIGPVISAGLLAHIYMGMWCSICHGRNEKHCQQRQDNKKLKIAKHTYMPEISVPTVGHIYQFAGIAGNKQRKWEKNTRRPFNAQLKTLCWKTGQSFMKFSNRQECYYGRIYRERKDYENAQNDAMQLTEEAAKGAARVRKTTEAYQYYITGKLPPGHIDARARRFAVKIFLSHLHAEWFRRQFKKEPPLPFAIAHLGHVHIIPPPPGMQAKF